MWFHPVADLFPQSVGYTEARYTGKSMRQRPRVVLVAGFGGLLLIMALAEAGALFFLNSLRHNDSALQARFLGRNRTLERIRSNIYLSGTFVRDSLLAPEQSGAQAQLATLDGLRRDSESALNSYAAALEPEEAAPFQDLRSQIEAYWKVLNRTFAWTSDERGKYRYAFFYEELVPRRTSMLQIADRIEALNEDALRRGDMKLGDLFGRLQFGLLAMIGIYGVLSNLVASRVREIGIRMAIGASPAEIGRLILRQSMLPVTLGLAIGLAGTFALGQFLQALLFRVEPRDPLTLAASAIAILLISPVALYVPLRRATGVDCTVALREE